MLFQCWAGVSLIVHLRQILLIRYGRPRDNALPVCTIKQQSQKAVFAHFTSEQILPLQADNVLQPVVFGRLRAVGAFYGRGIHTMPSVTLPRLAVSPAIM